ncbi:helix-turn-helix domain-containing protein (plasmid) [Paenibacillus sonchi]|uniref:Helix-turn-helix domain-containing protein n=1 Tax=Paenibacillus sonchi TaxID=373687 RepID=A0A974PIE1_9BACL|nr:helix-turn-helix transcriptional regulator [Paenibacillus sonchi]QQZ64485.1 helix-turn-helix domain-containing protein [Paenibacillus sonchi]
MTTFAEQIGAKIRLHRSRQKWTQEQLAEKSGTTASYIGQLERGEKDVRIQTLEKVATALGMSVYEVFDNEQQEGVLINKKWVWESVLLLLRHSHEKQHHAYRILKELLEPEHLEKAPEPKQ